MKRKTIGIFVFLLILLAGCSQNTSIDFSTKDISVGIIETRGNKKKSRIIFFDEEMKEIGELPLHFASVGQIFYTPLIKEDKLYIIPQGYANRKDEKTVLEIAMKDLSVKEYTIEQLAMCSVAVSKDFIYTCNTLNGNSYINKCDKEKNKTENIEIPEVYISKLLYVGEKLYAFGTERTKNGIMPSFLYIYDSMLNLQEKIDISHCGSGQHKAIEYNESIFFTNSLDSKDEPANILSIINIDDNSIELIKLTQNYPLDLAVYDNKLFITHFDLVRRLGGGLSIYDLSTKKKKYYELNHGAEQMSIANDKMYIMADWTVYVYNVKTMELIDSVNIHPMDNDFSYLSGMFAIEN